MATISPVRPSPIAGTWYEGNPKSLARAVDAYMDHAELPELPGEVIAVIALTPGISIRVPWQVMPLLPSAGATQTSWQSFRQCTSLTMKRY